MFQFPFSLTCFQSRRRQSRPSRLPSVDEVVIAVREIVRHITAARHQEGPIK